MPTYEYACRECGTHLDVVQRFTDEPLTTCPSCGGPLRKVFGSIGISFKGSGFYKNDSRAPENGAKKKEAAAEGGSSAGADTPTPDKADAPAAKGDGAKADGAKADGPKAGATKSGSTAAAS